MVIFSGKRRLVGSSLFSYSDDSRAVPWWFNG